MGIFCLLYQNKLAALASGELPDVLSERIERHLSACPSCLREWIAQEKLVGALRGAAPEPRLASPYLWEHLEAAIGQEVSAPTDNTRPGYRLAPLGALALAGVAVAALIVARPHDAVTTSQVAQILPVTHMSPVIRVGPKRATALELARRTQGQVSDNKPTRDPFAVSVASARPRNNSSRLPESAQVIRRIRALSTLRHPHLPPSFDIDIPQHAEKNAVAQLELGTIHIQTAEFNREVTEAEERDSGSAHRATCTPTDAIASARGETNLGIFQ